MSQIRLSEFEIDSIKSVFREFFLGDDEHLWIFGSRLNPNEYGGDIDLYIETKRDELSEIINLKIKFLVALKSKIGEQKIDVVLNRLKSEKNLPIYEEARKGIQII